LVASISAFKPVTAARCRLCGRESTSFATISAGTIQLARVLLQAHTNLYLSLYLPPFN
jgi:hypothetical protein